MSILRSAREKILRASKTVASSVRRASGAAAATLREEYKYSWWAAAIQAPLCLICWCGLLWAALGLTPYPGLAIGLLGFAAVIITIRANYFTKTEQVIWVIIAFVLFGIESRFIYQDRKENQATVEDDRRTQQAQFAQNEREFKETIEKGKKILGETQQVASLAKQSLENVTGGDTFCYLDVTATPVWLNGKASFHTVISLDVVKVGEYPCRELNITATDEIEVETVTQDLLRRDAQNNRPPPSDKAFEDMEQAQRLGTKVFPVQNLDVASSHLVSFPAVDGDSQRFLVTISAFNSPTRIERVNLKRANGQWRKAVMLESDEKGKADWIKIDKDFPRKNGRLDVDWPRRAVGRDKWDH